MSPEANRVRSYVKYDEGRSLDRSMNSNLKTTAQTRKTRFGEQNDNDSRSPLRSFNAGYQPATSFKNLASNDREQDGGYQSRYMQTDYKPSVANRQYEFTDQRGRAHQTELKSSAVYRRETTEAEAERMAFLKWKYEGGNQARATDPDAFKKFKESQQMP